MNDTTRSLTTLVDLRDREVDRLTSARAEQQALRDRYRRNLDRLEGLCAGSSGDTRPGALMAMALSLNHAGYKETVMAMADTHRHDLAVHEADMARTASALAAASVRREVMSHVLDDHTARLRVAADRRDQKRVDDLAVQVWARGNTR